MYFDGLDSSSILNNFLRFFFYRWFIQTIGFLCRISTSFPVRCFGSAIQLLCLSLKIPNILYGSWYKTCGRPNNGHFHVSFGFITLIKSLNSRLQFAVERNAASEWVKRQSNERKATKYMTRAFICSTLVAFRSFNGFFLIYPLISSKWIISPVVMCVYTH